jgi:hypothetical membrane protein
MTLASSPVRSADDQRSLVEILPQVAGLAFFLSAAQFFTVIMAASSMAPNYDLAGGAISDLGVIEATAPLFNASLIIVGVLNVVGAAALFSAERRLLPLGLHLVAGVAAAGAGLATLETGGVHGIFALLAFVFFNLQILGSALRLRGAIRPVGVALALWGLTYVVIMAIGDGGSPAVFGPIGHGGAERMIVYPPMFWLMVYGGFLMARPVRSSGDALSQPIDNPYENEMEPVA